MYAVTSQEMRKLDRYMIESIGIPAVVLMENAGRAAAAEICSFIRRRDNGNYPDRMKPDKPWLILTGKGNNGGDGLVAARHMRELNVDAEVLYAVEPEQLTGDAAFQRDVAHRLGIVSSVYAKGKVQWDRYAGLVDALLGTGTVGAPREPYASLIREANESGLPVAAIDIPSGLDADTGALNEPCIRADLTVALAFLKRGLTQYPGAAAAGNIVVKAIGIPHRLAKLHLIRTYVSDRNMFKELFGLEVPLTRPADTHKGSFGHVLVAAGTRKYSGAGLLSTAAALRSGAGLVSWALPDRLLDSVIGRVPEVMLAGVSDGGRGDWAATSADDLLRLVSGKDALAVGPGMDRFDGDGAWMRKIWTGAECPIVVDADALNMIAAAGDFGQWPKRSLPAILTPHPGEMARLTGLTVREVQRDRIGLARRYAEQHGVTLVLKGTRTVTATPEGDVFINTSGHPGMATGGAGDVLTGVIAGLLAQGCNAGPAAALGVCLHGEAGERAAAMRPTPGSLIAGDIINEL